MSLDNMRAMAEQCRDHHQCACSRYQVNKLGVELELARYELASAEAVIEALRSVLSEDGVREHLAAYVMGVETMNRLDAYDARGKA